ncbi:MAG: hypothetical protein JW844_05525 [Candidatus Omnitrophica bacterium]|nr:hypothetical protein [Candidatus Omnitrophota bacterium]
MGLSADRNAQNIGEISAFWEGIPVTERSFRDTVEGGRGGVNPAGVSVSKVEHFVSWPDSAVNIPTFIRAWEEPVCILRIERTNPQRDALFRSVHERRFSLNLSWHLYPTYPIFRGVLEFRNPAWTRPYYLEGIPDMRLGDIQGFIYDFINVRRWRLVVGDTSGRTFEVVLDVPGEEAEALYSDTKKAVAHYRDIRQESLDFNTAASAFMKEVPLEE